MYDGMIKLNWFTKAGLGLIALALILWGLNLQNNAIFFIKGFSIGLGMVFIIKGFYKNRALV
jgi:hypothetical protein